MDELIEKEEPFEEWHKGDRRGETTAFFQGAKDKKLKNKALIAFETEFHKGYTSGILCIKVSFGLSIEIRLY